jgi:Uncharacterized protein conserved in archaea
MQTVDRRVPDDKREFFKEPLGTDLVENDLSTLNKEQTLITVGDVVSLTVREHGLVPDVTIYDGMTERREMTEFADLVKSEGWKEVVVKNEAGTITAALFKAVKNALQGRKQIIRVEGEEDLATIPCILLSPKGTNIIYGWPGKGMMIIETNDEIIQKAQKLMEMTEELE